MCLKRYVRRRKHPTPMTIPRANGAPDMPPCEPHSAAQRRRYETISAVAGKDRNQLLRWNQIKLGVSTIGGSSVAAPPAKAGHVPETRTLHVFVFDFHDQFGAQRLPRQILTVTPPTLAPRHPVSGPFRRCLCGPSPPGVTDERIRAIGREKFHQFAALFQGETGTNAYVLEHAGIVEESKQQRSDGDILASFVPAKTGHYAVAVALVFDLQHHALVRFVSARH